MKTKALMICFLSQITSIGFAEPEDIPAPESSFYIKQLCDQLSGDVADYEHASTDWQLIMETRIRWTIFNYWVCITKFDYKKSSIIEARYKGLINAIKKNNAFKRTFEEPNFITSAKEFPRHGFESPDGKRFEITSLDAFRLENEKFLKFLNSL